MQKHGAGSPPDRRIRIAIFTEDDPVWTFPVWSKAIPALQKKFDIPLGVVGMVCLDALHPLVEKGFDSRAPTELGRMGEDGDAAGASDEVRRFGR